MEFVHFEGNTEDFSLFYKVNSLKEKDVVLARAGGGAAFHKDDLDIINELEDMFRYD